MRATLLCMFAVALVVAVLAVLRRRHVTTIPERWCYAPEPAGLAWLWLDEDDD